MRIALATALAVAASPAAADFAQRDLTRIEATTSGYAGGEYVSRAAPDRLTLMCVGCPTMQAVDVLVGRSTDGTGERLRRGETTAATMEATCRQRNPRCTLKTVEASGAVGIQSVWPMGGSAVSTVYLYEGSDLLTIRSIAGSEEAALANAARAIETLAPQIIGR